MQTPGASDGIEIQLDELGELNRLRATGSSERLRALEARFDSELSASRRLAVYGSLAPGRSNHGQLSQLDGEWRAGCSVTGELVAAGWGNTLGYRALRWSPTGPTVPIDLFVSDDLPDHWARLDEFEGPDYLRILVPVLEGDRVIAVANLYAARF